MQWSFLRLRIKLKPTVEFDLALVQLPLQIHILVTRLLLQICIEFGLAIAQLPMQIYALATCLLLQTYIDMRLAFEFVLTAMQRLNLIMQLLLQIRTAMQLTAEAVLAVPLNVRL